MKLTSTANTSTPTSTAAMAASSFWFIIMWTPTGCGSVGADQPRGEGVLAGRAGPVLQRVRQCFDRHLQVGQQVHVGI